MRCTNVSPTLSGSSVNEHCHTIKFHVKLQLFDAELDYEVGLGIVSQQLRETIRHAQSWCEFQDY